MSITPTPWAWAKWYDEPTPCIIGPEGDERVCEMNGNENGFANAELIVRAVNSHQAMKEALEEVQRWSYTQGFSIREKPMWTKVDKALTLANGGASE